jgi:DNA-binding transcriptional LysR family regulator
LDDWNLLRTFVVLAESRSVTDAASKFRLNNRTCSTALKTDWKAPLGAN